MPLPICIVSVYIYKNSHCLCLKYLEKKNVDCNLLFCLIKINFNIHIWLNC